MVHVEVAWGNYPAVFACYLFGILPQAIISLLKGICIGWESKLWLHRVFFTFSIRQVLWFGLNTWFFLIPIICVFEQFRFTWFLKAWIAHNHLLLFWIVQNLMVGPPPVIEVTRNCCLVVFQRFFELRSRAFLFLPVVFRRLNVLNFVYKFIK